MSKLQTDQVLGGLPVMSRLCGERGDTFLCLADSQGIVVSWNDAAGRISGYSASEVEGDSRVWSWLRAGDSPPADSKGIPFDYFEFTGEKEIVAKDGSVKHMGMSVIPVDDPVVGQARLMLLGCELLAYDAVEEGLKQERAYFKALFERSPDGTVLVDTDRRVLDANPAFQHMFGFSLEELRGIDIHDFILPPGHVHESHEASWQAGRGGLAHRRAQRQRRDGVVLHVSIVGAPVVVAGREIGMLSIYRDITDFMVAERELKESARFSGSLLERSPLPVIVFNPDTSVRYVNQAWETLTGYSASDIVGSEAPYPWWTDETQVKSKRQVQELFVDGVDGVEHTFKKRNGELFWVEITHTPIQKNRQTQYVLSNWVDLTARKRLERERREFEYKAQIASRLATVGQMAAGLAHEINNPLAGIIGLSDLLLQQPLIGENREYVEIINESAKRGAAILQGLLTFSRQRKPVRELVGINAVVETALRLIRHELEKNNISLVVELSPEVERTLADPGQLQEVFINLIINAKVEMTAANGGGTLKVSTRRDGDVASIEFEDDGPGIPVEYLSRVFDPFFTTRSPGEGTGLGLSICHGIINEHGGRLSVRSKTGEGTTFAVELPLIAAADDSGEE